MAEPELAARLAAEGLAPGRWGNACVRGSITIGLPGPGANITLEAGDRLELRADTDHDAVVGSAGVTCLEAHLPAGQLGPDPIRRAAGSW